MLAFFFCLMAGYLLSAPVTLQLDAAHQGDTDLAFLVEFLHLQRRWRYRRTRTEHGRLTLRIAKDGQASPVPPNPARREKLKALLPVLIRADHARRYLLRRVCLRRLDVQASLHAGDAAGSALLSGAVQAIGMLPPLWQRNIRIQCLPDFFHGRTTWRLRCIIRTRPGTIILTSLLLAAAWAAEQIHLRKEAHTWNIPSEN